MKTLAIIFFITTIIAVGIVYLFFDKWSDARDAAYTADFALGECIKVIGKPMAATSTASIYIPTSTPEIIESQEIKNPIDIPAGFSDCEWIIEDGYGDFYCDEAQNPREYNGIMNVYYNPFAYPKPIYTEPPIIESKPEIIEPVVEPKKICEGYDDFVGWGDDVTCINY